MYLHLILDISQKYLQVRVHYDKISWSIIRLWKGWGVSEVQPIPYLRYTLIK